MAGLSAPLAAADLTGSGPDCAEGPVRAVQAGTWRCGPEREGACSSDAGAGGVPHRGLPAGGGI